MTTLSTVDLYQKKVDEMVARLRALANKIESEAYPSFYHVDRSELAWTEHASDIIQEITMVFPDLKVYALINRASAIDTWRRDHKKKEAL